MPRRHLRCPFSFAREGGFHYHHADVSDEAEVVGWFDAVESHFGQPASIIVANAAIVSLGDTLSIAVADWNRTLAVNLTGAWLTARTGARRLIAGKMPGRIVFVGSWAAHAPHVELAAYCTAKAGLRMGAQSMALELADRGILPTREGQPADRCQDDAAAISGLTPYGFRGTRSLSNGLRRSRRIPPDTRARDEIRIRSGRQWRAACR